jgi:hypothetical protein
MRISLKGRPEAWQDVWIVQPDGTKDKARIKYHILTEPEHRALRREELQRIREVYGDDEERARAYAQIDLAIEMMSDEAAEKRRGLVIERVIDWDFLDADAEQEGTKLPCTLEAKQAVADLARLFGPIYKGLLDASGEGQAKNS